MLVLKVPAVGVDQVTAVFVAPVTDAVNNCVPPAPSGTLVGVTVTPTVGVRVMVAVADFVVSATLVAVRDTVCVVVIEAGAV